MKDLGLKNIDTLVNLVKCESQDQIEKWGVQDSHPLEWLAFLSEEFGEISKAINESVYREGSSTAVVSEAIQVATLSLKIAEMYMKETKQ